jgi:uncharacterized protein YjiK
MNAKSLTILSLCLIASCSIRAEDSESGLAAYKLQGKPITIQSVADDASGVTFNHKTGTLFVIENDEPSIRELSTDGKELRSISLPGFNDAEGITWIENDTFGIVEERRRKLVIIKLPADITNVPYASAKQNILVEPTAYKNVGLEGVAYDQKNDRLFIVKEKQPRRIYELKNWRNTSKTIKATHPWDAEKLSHGISDMAGICVDPQSGNLLILSDESRCIIECTPKGKEIARLPLTAGHAGLSANIPQPEGITLAPDGTLYLCSEPNLLYIFHQKE